MKDNPCESMDENGGCKAAGGKRCILVEAEICRRNYKKPSPSKS
jgi:hypothetical protein